MAAFVLVDTDVDIIVFRGAQIFSIASFFEFQQTIASRSGLVALKSVDLKPPINMGQCHLLGVGRIDFSI